MNLTDIPNEKQLWIKFWQFSNAFITMLNLRTEFMGLSFESIKRSVTNFKWHLEIQSFLLQLLFQRKTLFPTVPTTFISLPYLENWQLPFSSSSQAPIQPHLRMSHPHIPPSPTNYAPSSSNINPINANPKGSNLQPCYFLRKMNKNTNASIDED